MCFEWIRKVSKRINPGGKSSRDEYIFEKCDSDQDGEISSMEPTIPVSQTPFSKDSDGEYVDEYTCNPPPLAMIIVSALEIILFLDDEIVKFSTDNNTHNCTHNFMNGTLATLLIYCHDKKAQVWRYVTYMFVHNDLWHLVVNLLVQLMVGIPLEMVHKWRRVLTIYIAGVVAGSLATSIFDSEKSLIGASAGVYALCTAHVATVLMNWSEMKSPVLQLLTFLIMSWCDVGIGLHNRYVLEKKDGVSQIGHFIGAITGLLIGIDVLRNLKEQKWEKVVRWVNIVTYTGLITAAILCNVLYSLK